MSNYMRLIDQLKDYLLTSTNIIKSDDINDTNTRKLIKDVIEYVSIHNIIDCFTNSINPLSAYLYTTILDDFNYDIILDNKYNIDNKLISVYINNYINNDIEYVDIQHMRIYKINDFIFKYIIHTIRQLVYHLIYGNDTTIYNLLYYHSDLNNILNNNILYKNYIQRRREIPSWVYLKYIDINNRSDIEVIHLVKTKEIKDSIDKDGFKYGINDITKLGLSNYYKSGVDEIKNSKGLNYAYPINTKLNNIHYDTFGKHIIEFKLDINNTVMVYHRVDKEYQIIFE